YQLIIQEDMTL
ncbi:protein ovo, partial [Trichinella spiralis]